MSEGGMVRTHGMRVWSWHHLVLSLFCRDSVIECLPTCAAKGWTYLPSAANFAIRFTLFVKDDDRACQLSTRLRIIHSWNPWSKILLSTKILEFTELIDLLMLWVAHEQQLNVNFRGIRRICGSLYCSQPGWSEIVVASPVPRVGIIGAANEVWGNCLWTRYSRSQVVTCFWGQDTMSTGSDNEGSYKCGDLWNPTLSDTENDSFSDSLTCLCIRHT
jgi:hypothetical protein